MNRVADDERSEADGAECGDVAEGGEPWGVGTWQSGTALETDARTVSRCRQTRRGGSVSDQTREALALRPSALSVSLTPSAGGALKPVLGDARTGEAKVERRTGPKAVGRPTSPSGAG